MFINLIKLGWFLGYRQFIRSSIWSNILIILIMILTFLNLVVVSGLLVGIVEGAVESNRNFFSSDVIISSLRDNNNIQKSHDIRANLDIIDGVENYTSRYIASGFAESNFRERTDFLTDPIRVPATFAGINPEIENQVTNLSELVIEGEYLTENDVDKVLVGSSLIRRFFGNGNGTDETSELLDDVFEGTTLRVTINNIPKEVVVKGIVSAKVEQIDRRIFILDSQLKNIIAPPDDNVNEIAVKLNTSLTPDALKNILIDNGFGEYAKIQTFEGAQSSFLDDIRNTMELLGFIIGSIGLVVASITIFIVIFINAITRRKYIGIMKGIGIDKKAIELAYIFQSLTYALIGSIIGLFILYIFLVPFFQNNPIDFPFSDGILAAPLGDTLVRITLLIFTTALAGYVPARLIIKKNTLDSILGRK